MPAPGNPRWRGERDGNASYATSHMRFIPAGAGKVHILAEMVYDAQTVQHNLTSHYASYMLKNLLRVWCVYCVVSAGT
jgi:hypothetical protein